MQRKFRLSMFTFLVTVLLLLSVQQTSGAWATDDTEYFWMPVDVAIAPPGTDSSATASVSYYFDFEVDIGGNGPMDGWASGTELETSNGAITIGFKKIKAEYQKYHTFFGIIDRRIWFEDSGALTDIDVEPEGTTDQSYISNYPDYINDYPVMNFDELGYDSQESYYDRTNTNSLRTFSHSTYDGWQMGLSIEIDFKAGAVPISLTIDTGYDQSISQTYEGGNYYMYDTEATPSGEFKIHKLYEDDSGGCFTDGSITYC